MEQKMVSTIYYCIRKEALSWCELNFNSLSHKIFSLSWSRYICHQKNTLRLYSMQERHGFTVVSNPVSKDHPRYSSVKRFKYYQILRKYNDWVITVIIKKGTDEEEYESVHKVVLDALVNNTSQAIQVGSIGAIDVDNRHSHGF